MKKWDKVRNINLLKNLEKHPRVDPPHLFLLLVTGSIIILGGWYLFIYHPQLNNIDETNMVLENIEQKLRTVKIAQRSIEATRKRFQQDSEELKNIKQRILDDQNLLPFTSHLEKFLETYQLKLTDFMPLLKKSDYDNLQSEVEPLLVKISITGEYINIGKFLDAQGSLPGHFSPQAISIESIKSLAKGVQADITAYIHIWNKNAPKKR